MLGILLRVLLETELGAFKFFSTGAVPVRLAGWRLDRPSRPLMDDHLPGFHGD